MARTGRPTLFPKDGPDIHGRISEAAGVKFEEARAKVAQRALADLEWKGKVSDGDVIEFLVKGWP